MTRLQIINELKNYFDIRELVCPHTYAKFGDKSWQFLDTESLHVLLVLRIDILKVPFTINNYHKGLDKTQRGLRCNICKLVRDKTLKNEIYLSSHANGAGFDIIPSGMTADQARKKIESRKALLPYPVRLERNVSWVHIDIYDYCNGNQVNYF